MELHTMPFFIGPPVKESDFQIKNKFYHKSKYMQVLASNELRWPAKLKINFITRNPNKCKYWQAIGQLYE